MKSDAPKAFDEIFISKKCAWLYYVGRLNQNQIAKKVGLSKMRVHRLIAFAEKKGFVKITIDRDSQKDKFQLSAYALSEDQKSETLIEVKKEIDPSKIKSNLNSSVVSMGSGSPKSDANQPCEIWIHKIELKALN